MNRLVRRLGTLVVATGLLAAIAVPTTGEAMPLAPTVAVAAEGPGIIAVQHRPGYYAGRQYRRSMRRYRSNPGARREIRQNRREFCRGAPQYC